MSEYLFSYGTLQIEKTQLDLFGKVLHGTSDILPGYKVVTIQIADEVFLNKGEDPHQKTLVASNKIEDHITGTALELSQDDLLQADSYEPNNYKRIKVTLASGKEAWVYIADVRSL